MREFAETPGPRLLVAPHRAHLIAPERLRQILEILRHIARQRRSQVIAQRQPLPIIVFERKHALIRAVRIGEEFPQRIGIFESRRLQRLKTVRGIDAPDGVEHPRLCRKLGFIAVAKAARQPRLRPKRLACNIFGALLVHGVPIQQEEKGEKGVESEEE